jgi:organizing structure protein 2
MERPLLTPLQRKPIYDDFEIPKPNPAPVTPPPAAAQPAEPVDEEEPKARSPTPTDRLAVHIGKARLALYEYAVAAENKVNETMDSAFNLEQSFTSTIASLAPSRESGEQLMPGAIYVLVAAMAGSIITRNRSIVLRASLPLALGIGAGWTVLPVTMRNISDLTWKYEQRFPVVAQSHIRLRESILNGVSFAKTHSEVGVRYVDEKVTDAREAVEGWVQKGK